MSHNYIPRRITIAEMAPHVHSFGIGENKANKIAKWLNVWITKSLKTGMVKYHDFLPLKGDLAFHIGVSKGTIQNAFRILEDIGMVESKQKIGTYIKENNSSHYIEKLTSKREEAVEIIKQHILDNNYSLGERILSTRELSNITRFSSTTIRTAINTLMLEGVISKKGKYFVISNIDFDVRNIESKTLVEKIAAKIRQYAEQNFEEGDKLPSNNELAKMYNVSIKTVHDAVKYLIQTGILSTRRGRYGTRVASLQKENTLYDYEKIELKIKEYILKECSIGDKLPTIRVFAAKYNVSTKTVKKALDNLSDDGYIAFSRGRNGGTFVTDIPQGVNEAYTWLALNPEYIKESEN